MKAKRSLQKAVVQGRQTSAGEQQEEQAVNARLAHMTSNSRVRFPIEAAQAELAKLIQQYDALTAQRGQLQRRLRFLELATNTSTEAELLHKLVLDCMAVKKSPNEIPFGLEPSESFVPLDVLPVSLTMYSPALLERMSNFTIGDTLQLYKQMTSQVAAMAMHVECHGSASYMSKRLKDQITRYCNCVMVTSMNVAISSRVHTTNFLTGDQQEAPEGWYSRIAGMLPDNAELMAFAQEGLAMLKSSVERNNAQSGTFAGHVLSTLLHQQYNTSSVQGLYELDGMLAEIGKSTSAEVVQRNTLACHLLSYLLDHMPAVTLARVLCAIWPFSMRGIVVIQEYVRLGDRSARAAGQAGYRGSQASDTDNRPGHVMLLSDSPRDGQHACSN